MKSTTTAAVIADSMSVSGRRVSTLLIRYPMRAHREILRHRGPAYRQVSHSVRSTRAVPFAQQIAAVRTDPFIPSVFTSAKRGMVGGEPLSGEAEDAAIQSVLRAANHVADECQVQADMGVHQEVAAGMLDGFTWIEDLITAETWANFLHLREAPDAQPEAQRIARAVRAALQSSAPRRVRSAHWHLPFITATDAALDVSTQLLVSAARCARVSYGSPNRAPDEEVGLARRCIASGHWSPFEHQRTPGHGQAEWLTYRSTFLHEAGEHWPEPSHLEVIE